MHPTAHIDLDALVANYRFLCEKAAGVDMGAAVKANAYGLGAPQGAGIVGRRCRTSVAG